MKGKLRTRIEGRWSIILIASQVLYKNSWPSVLPLQPTIPLYNNIDALHIKNEKRDKKLYINIYYTDTCFLCIFVHRYYYTIATTINTIKLLLLLLLRCMYVLTLPIVTRKNPFTFFHWFKEAREEIEKRFWRTRVFFIVRPTLSNLLSTSSRFF